MNPLHTHFPPAGRRRHRCGAPARTRPAPGARARGLCVRRAGRHLRRAARAHRPPAGVAGGPGFAPGRPRCRHAVELGGPYRPDLCPDPVGPVWVPVNTRLRAAGLQYLLRHARPRLLVAGDEYAEAIEQARQYGVPLASGTDIDAVAARADVAPAALPPARIRHADTLCIIYTSGTTGAPKGVLFTHRMMRIASEATLRVANAKAGDRLFVWEPLCHIGGAQMLMVPFRNRCSCTWSSASRHRASGSNGAAPGRRICITWAAYSTSWRRRRNRRKATSRPPGARAWPPAHGMRSASAWAARYASATA